MRLKEEFTSFVKEDLDIPLVGISKPDDFTREEMARVTAFKDAASHYVSIPEEMKKNIQLKDVLDSACSVIVIAIPNYPNRPLSFSQCRKELLGTTSALHVTNELQERTRDRSAGIRSFFKDKGFACIELSMPLMLPVKILASRCGIGYYGKNSMILNADYGSWISLIGFITDAHLESDEAVSGDCKECNLCLKACPAKALHIPYQCDVSRCVNFHIIQNKKWIPEEIRSACRNLIGQGCTVCKDVCPHNKQLRPLSDVCAPKDLLNPSLLNILAMDETGWEKTFGNTLMGFSLGDKKYLKRNACIALGNFKDERALEVLVHVLENGADEVKGYAAWALGRIGTRKAQEALEKLLSKDLPSSVRSEIKYALTMI